MNNVQVKSSDYIDSYSDRQSLEKIFDEMYKTLDGGVLLTHKEYIRMREFQVGSGLFAFQLAQSCC